MAGTIVTDLAKKTKEVSDLVGRTYTYFRPFIDEPFGGVQKIRQNFDPTLVRR